jgi:hypothetical protein
MDGEPRERGGLVLFLNPRTSVNESRLPGSCGDLGLTSGLASPTRPPAERSRPGGGSGFMHKFS